MTRHVMLTAGPFGQAVAFCAQRQADIIVRPLLPDAEANAAAVKDADFISVAAWRPHARALQCLDDLCHRRGVPASFADMHGQRLTIGPLIIPNAAGNGCYHCYLKRWNAHHPAPEREMVIEAAYARDWALGPAGYIQPLVSIAAAALLEDSAACAARAASLRVVDVLTGSVLQSRVIGIHRCPRCRPEPAGRRPGERFVEHIGPEMKALLA
jgi:bacteriocin biosynthesis cyclodehydratase domain-containing protein